jgi:CRP/FNR family cyclic AMP-dependent transcriptional regulator
VKGLAGALLGAGMVNAWVVPAIIFVLLIVAAWLGLRWIRSEHLEALRSAPLFSLLSEHELLSVLSSARAVAFSSGAVVIQQGEKGKGFFVITDGTAGVTLDGEDLVTLASGSYFGEMAVIDGGPRTATITAQTELSTLEITPTAFLRLVDREPMVAQAFYAERAGDSRWREVRSMRSPAPEST